MKAIDFFLHLNKYTNFLQYPKECNENTIKKPLAMSGFLSKGTPFLLQNRS